MKKNIIMKPIGRIKTPFKTREDLNIPPYKPEAPYHDPTIKGTIEVFDEYVEGIATIKPGTKGILLFHFDKSTDYTLTTSFHASKERVGVFSTRSPRRPNGIGTTVVNFLEVEGNKIVFQGVDMLDGTPLLDIKPYGKPQRDGEPE